MNRKENLRDYNKKVYSLIADDFDTTRQARWASIDHFTGAVKSDMSVLDLGCGNGRLLKALPSVNFKYLGIDSNETLLEHARHDYPNNEFQRSDLESIDLLEKQYDMIFCIATFHHLVSKEDRIRLLHQCYASLKPGGQIVVTVWNLWQPQYRKYILKNISKKVTWNDFFIPWTAFNKTIWRYYHGFTKKELTRLFRMAGFKSISFDTTNNGQIDPCRYNIVIHSKK